MSKKRNFRKRNHSDDAPSDSDDDNATELGLVYNGDKNIDILLYYRPFSTTTVQSDKLKDWFTLLLTKWLARRVLDNRLVRRIAVYT